MRRMRRVRKKESNDDGVDDEKVDEEEKDDEELRGERQQEEKAQNEVKEGARRSKRRTSLIPASAPDSKIYRRPTHKPITVTLQLKLLTRR